MIDDRAVTKAWQTGRGAWPQVTLELDRFAAHVASVDPEGVSRFPEDLYLAAACLTGDPAALALFDREMLSSARGAIASILASGEAIDEALQRLRASLMVGDAGGSSARLSTYAGRGPLRAWVGIAAARTALMMKRSQKRSREVSAGDDDWASSLAMISTSDPELELLKRQYADAFQQALRDAVGRLEPRIRNVLKMSFVDALSIDQIGTIYVVHRATAARWIQRGCDEVFEQTRALLAERLALSASEMDQMHALVKSQLDLSLSQLLPSNIE